MRQVCLDEPISSDNGGPLRHAICALLLQLREETVEAIIGCKGVAFVEYEPDYMLRLERGN